MDPQLETLRSKIFDIANPDVNYNIEDFYGEFGDRTLTSIDTPVKISVRFANKSNNPDPDFATNGSSGFDLRASLEEQIKITPHEYKLIKTGLYFEIPDNMEITIRSRSGLAYKYGISVLNGVGTIDSDYRGEIGVLLINHGKEDFVVDNGDRIAQGVITSVMSKNIITLDKVTEVSNNSERSTGGYGSTGIQ